MKTDSFFPAFSSRLFRKWFGILDHALYVFKAFRTQFDCHAIFVGNIERKFDAGVYGMSGLMLEIGQEYPHVEVEVIPGVTAANGGAAVLGAPLIHDFAVISLSDLMTPWEKIEKRLLCASEADFVICLYNPSSK